MEHLSGTLPITIKQSAYLSNIQPLLLYFCKLK